MRILVDIPQPQLDSLNAMARQQATARAELVRRAVAEYLQHHAPAVADVRQQAFGLWADRRDIPDGLAYQQALRDEWS